MDSRFKVTTLSTDNYSVWSREAKAYLILNGLWCAVDESAAFLALEQQKRDEQSARALAVIQLSIGHDISETIVTCDTPKEAWEALRDTFKLATLGRKLQLNKEILNCSPRAS